MTPDTECLRPGVYLRQDPRLKLTTDALLLADFAQPRRRSAICELGCGSGAVSLLLCAADPTCTAIGIESDAQACTLARESAALSNLADRFTIHCMDLRTCRTVFPHSRFDCVVSNPPYFPSGENPARAECGCTLQDVCAAAAWLLKTGGRFYMIYRPERLADAICALRSCNLEPKRIRYVRHRIGKPVNLVLLESRLGGHSGLIHLPDLILFEPDGRESAAYRAICGRKET